MDNALLLGIFRTVQGRRSMWVMALVLLWVPLMSHCRLAALAGLEFLRCSSHAESQALHSGDSLATDSHHHDASHPEGDDGCCAVEDLQFLTRVDVEETWLLVPMADAGVALFGWVASAESVAAATPQAMGDSPPPDLIPSWRFLLRASPPTRAPSFVS